MITANDVLSVLQSAFPGAIQEFRVEADNRLWATVNPNKMVEICKFLRDEQDFDHYSGAAGVDKIDEDLFEVTEILASHGAHPVVALLKVKTPRDAPSVKSLTDLFWNANWYEREIWEMFGLTSKIILASIRFFSWTSWWDPGPGERTSRATRTTTRTKGCWR